ncbi:MAG: hypothetical protein M3R36_11810 [Bacteroidota bacterium]|nr:hypothetical protein [Bacteroidota bacterium]
MFKTIFLFIFSLILFSCSKENPSKDKTEIQNNELTREENTDTDTNMTVEESLSIALVQDILKEDDDVDLQLYLEEQIYPIVAKSNKVTFDRISSSLYLLSYDDSGAVKNILIQKFYNPVKDEFIFEKSETQTNAAKQFVK